MFIRTSLFSVQKRYVSWFKRFTSLVPGFTYTKFVTLCLVPPIDERLKQLILEKQSDYGYKVLEMEVMSDHVHLLIDVNPKRGVYYVVNRIKGYTSHVLREEFPELKRKLPTLWTHSKFISSVGAVTLDVVKKYIEEQKGV
jgi:putative transposase